MGKFDLSAGDSNDDDSSSGFNLSATAMCQECGQWLSSSDEAHGCPAAGADEVEHVFREIGGDNEIIITAVSTDGAWRKLATTVDDPLPWAYFGPVRFNKTSPVEVSAAFYQRTGQDLREL